MDGGELSLLRHGLAGADAPPIIAPKPHSLSLRL